MTNIAVSDPTLPRYGSDRVQRAVEGDKVSTVTR